MQIYGYDNYIKLMGSEYHLPEGYFYTIIPHAFGGYRFSLRRKRKYFFSALVADTIEHPMDFNTTAEMCLKAAERLKKKYKDQIFRQGRAKQTADDLGF